MENVLKITELFEDKYAEIYAEFVKTYSAHNTHMQHICRIFPAYASSSDGEC